MGAEMQVEHLDLGKLRESLRVSEGVRYRPYLDSVGKLTIGVGHNLDAKPLSPRAVAVILDDDISDAIDDLDRHTPWWRTLDGARQLVMAEMCFNLGIGGLLTFRNTLTAMETGRYTDAAEGMLKSKWARQVGQRAVRLARVMMTGEV